MSSKKSKCHYKNKWLRHKDYTERLNLKSFEQYAKSMFQRLGDRNISWWLESFTSRYSFQGEKKIPWNAQQQINQEYNYHHFPRVKNDSPVSGSAVKKASINKIIKKETVKVKVRWTRESMMSDYSHISCSTKSELSAVMFSAII